MNILSDKNDIKSFVCKTDVLTLGKSTDFSNPLKNQIISCDKTLLFQAMQKCISIILSPQISTVAVTD
ncbi:MAG: hypothetical protein IKO06_05970 [Alphaproteobacteria bacterium]|nr:hypothetical protein [Alphaproteobacteria bacterium]